MLIRVLCLLTTVVVALNAEHDIRRRRSSKTYAKRKIPSIDIPDNEIVLAFVVFRHGARTSDTEELRVYPAAHLNISIFHPHGIKSLTNVGKKQTYKAGKYLRRRYNGFLSDLYLPGEITIRSTNYARTKMSVLSVLAGLYPPKPLQRWNRNLDWQPIPYDILPDKEDDLQPYISCPEYIRLKQELYNCPKIVEILNKNKGFLNMLSKKTGYDFKWPDEVYYFCGLLQTLENVGVKHPQWVQDAMPKLKELKSLSLKCSFHTVQQRRLAGGVVLGDFVRASNAIIDGDKSQPKMHLLSGHENSVAGVMAAVNVFDKSYPDYAAVFSLELYRNKKTNKYGVMGVYAAKVGGPGKVIPIPGCGGQSLCDFDTFVNLTRGICITRRQFVAECHT